MDKLGRVSSSLVMKRLSLLDLLYCTLSLSLSLSLSHLLVVSMSFFSLSLYARFFLFDRLWRKLRLWERRRPSLSCCLTSSVHSNRSLPTDRSASAKLPVVALLVVQRPNTFIGAEVDYRMGLRKLNFAEIWKNCVVPQPRIPCAARFIQNFES